jgi:hypothetical protein
MMGGHEKKKTFLSKDHLCCEGGFSVIVGNNHLRKKYIRGNKQKKSKKGLYSSILPHHLSCPHFYIPRRRRRKPFFLTIGTWRDPARWR